MKEYSIRFVLLGLTVLAWQSIGMIGKAISSSYKHYYFFTWLAHNCFVGAALVYFFCTYYCNLKYHNEAIKHDFTSGQFHFAALVLCCVGMLVAMTWFYSLPITVLSANNAIYQTAPIFVFIFSVFFLGESVTAQKIVALIVCFSGVLLVSFFTKTQHLENGQTQKSTFIGYMLVLLSSILFAVYEVFYHWSFHYKSLRDEEMKHEILSMEEDDDEAQVDANVQNEIVQEDNGIHRVDQFLNSLRLLSLIGFYNLLALYPGAWLVGVIGLEPPLEDPDREIFFRIVLLGIAELLYNIFLFAGLAKAGPVFMAVGQILIVPTSYLFEIIENNGIPPHHTILNYVGITLILLGFVVLQDLTCTKSLFSLLQTPRTGSNREVVEIA